MLYNVYRHKKQEVIVQQKSKSSTPLPRRNISPGIAIALGIAIGAALGSATGDVAVWTAIGPALGLAFSELLRNRG
jgi:hypothetical protein